VGKDEGDDGKRSQAGDETRYRQFLHTQYPGRYDGSMQLYKKAPEL
jgi:hypothetical protein